MQDTDVEGVGMSRRGDGPPIVFIHGVMLDRRMWVPQLREFSDEYEMLAYDVRGHGETGPTTEAEYTRQLLADDLGQVVAGFDQPPVICGHSMGGAIAVTYAANNPEEVSGLVTVGLSETPERGTVRRLLRGAGTAVYKGLVRFTGKNRTDRLIAGTMNRLGDPEEWQMAAQKVDEDEYWKLNEVDTGSADTLPTDQLEVPVAFVRGSNESGEVDPLAESVEDGRAVVVPDSGHTPPRENPEAFNDALGDFLGDAAARE